MMGTMDSLTSPTASFVTAGINGLVLREQNNVPSVNGLTNNTVLRGKDKELEDIFPEGVNILFPDANPSGDKEVVVVKTTRKKKKRPPREEFQSFDRMYTLMTEDYLGSGSYSHVFVCTRTRTGERFAAKIVSKDHSISRDRIFNEIDLHHLCRHQKNILNLIQFFEESSRYIFVYPVMNGGSLLKHIERKKLFTETEAKAVVKDLTAALSFLHKHGVAHRDLKPDNVLCDNDETIIPVKICDFDLSSGSGSWTKIVSTPVLQTPVGSAEYMAPEVVDAFVNDDEATCYDKRCDLWSLGVILYVILSGHPPFYGNCDEECGWDRNEACGKCQDLLMHSIQDGRYRLSGVEWGHVSDEAKDLISHLLVRDASLRYSAETVLHSPWITKGTCSEEKTTGTPSVQSPPVNFDIAGFLTDANAANRTLAERAAKLASKSDKTNLFGLSPPGSSSLAKRRAYKSNMK